MYKLMSFQHNTRHKMKAGRLWCSACPLNESFHDTLLLYLSDIHTWLILQM